MGKLHIIHSKDTDVILPRMERMLKIMENDWYDDTYYQAAYDRIWEAWTHYQNFLSVNEFESDSELSE